MTSQYVSKLFNETVGLIRFLPDTDLPIGPVSDRDAARRFRKAHPHLSDEQYQKMGQFIYDFAFCFGRIYQDYLHGRIIFPVEEVARDFIEELIKAHYPTKYTMLLHDAEFIDCISSTLDMFKEIIQEEEFDLIPQSHLQELNPAGVFGFIGGRRLVNMLSIRLAELEKREEFIPL